MKVVRKIWRHLRLKVPYKNTPHSSRQQIDPEKKEKNVFMFFIAVRKLSFLKTVNGF